MIKNARRYIRTLIDVDKLLVDTDNRYVLVSQRRYNGKTQDNGDVVLEPGVTVTLQIITDNSDPVYDRNGNLQDDNCLETFDVTVVGCQYPLPMKKGTKVSLGGFLSDYSYYIDYNLILRFTSITPCD